MQMDAIPTEPSLPQAKQSWLSQPLLLCQSAAVSGGREEGNSELTIPFPNRERILGKPTHGKECSPSQPASGEKNVYL